MSTSTQIPTRILNNELITKLLDIQYALANEMSSLDLTKQENIVKLKVLSEKLNKYQQLNNQVENFVTQKLKEIESL